MKKHELWAAIAMAGLLLPVAGCKPDAAVKTPATIDRSPARPANTPALPPEATGTVSGTISFKGLPPVPKTIDTSMDPACDITGSGKLPTEQFVVKNGKLANVFLYVKTGPPAAMNAAGPAAPVVLDQKHCQYVPHVIGVMQGGTVEFRNSDVTMHNIHTMPTTVGNEPIDVSMGPRGQPVVKQFNKPELMLPVRCNNHPWMNAFINVSATPFFAVSDAEGHFELRGLPPGDYTIGAVHEKLGEKTLQVTVTAQATAKADFSFAQ
jgi:plastocyanin